VVVPRQKSERKQKKNQNDLIHTACGAVKLTLENGDNYFLQSQLNSTNQHKIKYLK
jgi:hypothetical protein